MARYAEVPCAHCGKPVTKQVRCINHAAKEGRKLYCNRQCDGLARRLNKTVEQKKAEKRAYDAEYRDRNRALLKQKKAEYFQQTYDPDAAREQRKAKMPRHVEYCRQPEYKAKKHEYDTRQTDRQYGEYASAFRVLQELEREVRRQVPDKYERRKARGYIERQIQRQKERRRNAKAEQAESGR